MTPTNSGYGRRRLPYPYSYVVRLVQDTDGISKPEEEDDQSGCLSLYPVMLSDADVLKFTSALQAGYDLIYPDNWQDDMDAWLQAREYRNNLEIVFETMGACEVSICDLVKECIETNPGVIEAIEGVIEGYIPEIGEELEDNPGAVGGTVPGAVDNNLDCVYGALNDTYEDIIKQYWDVLKVPVEAAADLSEVIRDLPFVSLSSSKYFEVIETLISVGVTDYEAHINNQTTKDNVVCAAFDRICNRGPSYAMNSGDVDAMFSALGNGQPVPFVNELIRQVSVYSTIKTYWARRTDDTCSNDWEIVCNCTPGGWCWNADWSTIFFESGWTNDDEPGTDIGGALRLASNGQGFITESGVPVGLCTPTRIEVDVQSTTDNGGAQQVTIQARRTSDDATLLSFNITITSPPQTFDVPFALTDDFYLRLAARTGTGNTVISAVRLFGDNDPPPDAGCP